jgi:ABC-type Fe3+-hydroxamate transport system substrate-binding protein
MKLDRRSVLAGLGALSLARPALAAPVKDATGRTLEIPNKVTRVFPAEPPNHALRAASRACLLRTGAIVAEGATKDVLTRGNLEALYGAPVQPVTDAARVAFLPG